MHLVVLVLLTFRINAAHDVCLFSVTR